MLYIIIYRCIAAEWPSYSNEKICIIMLLELSHRSKEYATLNQEAIDNIRKLL